MSEVLLVGSRTETLIGRPLIPQAKVITSVEEITKDIKVVCFKMRRRKNSKRTKGFRRQIVVLRVTDIIGGSEVKSQTTETAAAPRVPTH